MRARNNKETLSYLRSLWDLYFLLLGAGLIALELSVDILIPNGFLNDKTFGIIATYPLIQAGGVMIGIGLLPSVNRRITDEEKRVKFVFGILQAGATLVALFYISRIILNFGAQVTSISCDITVFKICEIGLISDLGKVLVYASGTLLLGMFFGFVRTRMRES